MTIKKFVHDFTDSQISDLFQRALELEGFILDGDESWVSMDGKTHYVKVQNATTGNKIKKSAWYKGYIDDFPSGTFGWFHGNKDTFSWSLWAHCKDNNIAVQHRSMTKEEQAEREKENLRQAKIKERALQEQALMASLISKLEIKRSLDLQPHPYVDKKKLDLAFAGQFARTLNPTPYTHAEVREFLKSESQANNKTYVVDKIIDIQENYFKFRNGYLIIAGYNLDFEIVFFQLIAAKKNKDGIDKWFPKTFPKHETFGYIGPQITDETTSIIICEGWATALSIAKFIKFSIPVLFAWDSGNMQAVALTVRSRYRKIKIWSGNDNDHTKPYKDNAGLQGGRKLCSAVGAYAIPPDFNPLDPNDVSNSDWNDMELCYGLEIGMSRFKNVCKMSEFTPAEFDPYTSLFYPPKRPNYDEPEPPEVEVILEPVEFTSILLPCLQVTQLGIQYLKISAEEKIKWFHDEFDAAHEVLVKSGLIDLKDQLTSQELDLQVDEIILPFALEIAESDGNLFLHIENITKTIHRMLSLALNRELTINLLSYIRDIVQSISNPKFANSVMENCLKSTNYFKPRKAFFIDVIQMVKRSQRIVSMNEHLAWSTLANLNETAYWECLPEEKETLLVEDFCKVYHGLEDTYEDPEPHLSNYSAQESKLRFLDKAFSDLALMIDMLKDDVNPIASLEKQILYILRLVDRINETEHTEINPDLCILSNLSCLIEEPLALNQYNFLKTKYRNANSLAPSA